MEQVLRFIGPPLLAAMSIPLFHIPIMRLRKRNGETFMWMALSFSVSLCVWLAISTTIPSEEYVLTSLALLGFLWLGYLELMFKIYRGFSYTLLTDIGKLQPVTTDRLSDEFAGGTGMNGMLHRRIATLVSSSLLRRENDTLILTSKGRRGALITATYKSFLKLGLGG